MKYLIIILMLFISCIQLPTEANGAPERRNRSMGVPKSAESLDSVEE